MQGGHAMKSWRFDCEVEELRCVDHQLAAFFMMATLALSELIKTWNRHRVKLPAT